MEGVKVVDLTEHLVELIRRTSCELAEDVVIALRAAAKNEEQGSSAQGALETILVNIDLARKTSKPICQDTGTPNFYIALPVGYSSAAIGDQVRQALALASQRSYLRPNAVDSLTGKNSGDNTGILFPTIHWSESPDQSIHVQLILKGGGCENVSTQYSLPDTELKAGRDLKGIAKVVLHAVYKAQGQGCSPAVLGVGIGGDRATSHVMAKKQLFRKLDDVNPNPDLAKLEAEITAKANRLEIGPMGFGGKTTVLGVKAGALHRLPASFFVSIAYMCWAHRRGGMVWNQGEVRYA